VTYEIQRVRKVIDITPQGTIREAVEVSYRTSKGAESWVRVPADQCDPQRIRLMIEEESRRLDSIYGGS